MGFAHCPCHQGLPYFAMAWALQVALAWSTGTWALISWTTQLQVKGIKPAGGVLANFAKSFVASFVQRSLITVSRKLWAWTVGGSAPAVPTAMAITVVWAQRLTRSCKRDGGLLGMGFLDEVRGRAGSMVFQVLQASSTSKTSHTFGRPTGKPRVRLGPTEGTLMLGWQLWAAGAAVLAALTAVFAKFGIEGIDSNLATLLRTVVVVVALTGLLAINGQLRWQQLVLLPRTSLAALALSGLATGASWLCYFKALQFGPVARVAAIDKFSVVLIAVFGVWVLGEQLGPRGWIGVVLMAAGALLVALP